MIKYYFLTFILIFIKLSFVFAQDELKKPNKKQPIYQIHRNEPTSEFKFEPFERGFDEASIKAGFDSLNQKSYNEWNFEDSLKMAIYLLKNENFNQAYKQFQKISIQKIKDPLHFKYYITCLQLNKEYEKAQEAINVFIKKFPDKIELISAQKRIITFHIYLKNKEINNKWIVANHILPIDFQNDSIRKDTAVFNRVLKVLRQYDQELHFQTKFVFEDDYIISAVANDMGQILEKHFSYSQAYIAYNIARNYDKSNKDALENLKRVRNHLNEKKWHLPIFRNYFPRKKKGRFKLESIIDKIQKEKEDSLNQRKPVVAIQEKDKKPHEKWLGKFHNDLLYMVILIVILLFVIIFVKPIK